MTAVRHSAATMLEAQRLAAAGWTSQGIVRVFARNGITVTERTVKRWVDPDFAAKRRRSQVLREREKNAAARGGRLAGPPRSPEFRQARIESLAKLGVSMAAIAKVMSFDFPNEPITVRVVEHALQTGRPPKVYRDAFDGPGRTG